MHLLDTSRDAVSTASLLQCWWIPELHLPALCHCTWSSISYWNWAQQLQGCWVIVTLSHSHALTHPISNLSHWFPHPKLDAFPWDARLLSMPSGCAGCFTLTLPWPPTVLHSSVLPESKKLFAFIMNHMKAALTDKSESAFPLLI